MYYSYMLTDPNMFVRNDLPVLWFILDQLIFFMIIITRIFGKLKDVFGDSQPVRKIYFDVLKSFASE